MVNEAMKYFDLNDDIYFPNRWYLGDFSGVDNWKLAKSVPDKIDSLTLEMEQEGEEMDFTFTEAYRVPVVSSKIKLLLRDIKEVYFVPVTVNGKHCVSEYFAMIVPETVDCVDEKRSEFQKFQDDDPVRPDKSGEYRGFTRLRLDEKRTLGKDVFRLKNYDIAIVISEKVKDRLMAANVTGIDVAAIT
jgi:hypothetical protein